MHRRTVVRHLLAALPAAAAATAGWPLSAVAQRSNPGTGAPSGAAAGFPSRAVTLVVPFPPGGGSDTGARILAEHLSRRWGKPVVVENKGGAAGQIGADLVAKAPPDGHTLLIGNVGTQAINPVLYAKLPYDPDKAFVPVAHIADLPLALLVNPEVPTRTPAELIALLKAQPGKLSYSSSGSGGAPHLVAELFKAQTGTFALHVPYRGGGPAVSDLIAGHVQLSFVTVLEASGHIRAGKLRALAVTGSQRVAAFPDVPTLTETVLPGFNASSWLGLLAPAATPVALVDKLSADLREVLADEAVKARFAQLGGVSRGSTPAQFAKLIADDRRRYGDIVRTRKITVD